MEDSFCFFISLSLFTSQPLRDRRRRLTLFFPGTHQGGGAVGGGGGVPTQTKEVRLLTKGPLLSGALRHVSLGGATREQRNAAVVSLKNQTLARRHLPAFV